MKSGATVQNQILDGVIWKQMLLFFFPIFLGTLFQQCYSMIDAIMIGQCVGKQALAAVGGADSDLINLLLNFSVGISSGASVVISQHWGARRYDSLRQAVCTAMALAVSMGALLTVLGVFLAPKLLIAMKTPAEIQDDAVTFLRFYFLGMLPSMLYNMGAGILRAVGDSRRPLYYLLICCAVNIALDLLFIPVLHLDVAGAAFATSLSQVVSAVLILRTLLRTREPYRLVFRKAQFSRAQMGRMLRIGLAAGIQSAMYNVSNLLIQVAINTLGTNSIAAWAAFRKIDAFYWPVSNALNITVMTFTGQNFGARRYDRLRKVVRDGLLIDLSISLFFSSVVLLLRWPLIRLFTSDTSVVPLGVQLICSLCPYYALFIFSEVFSGTMRGVGESLRPALLTMFGVCVIRILYLLLFAYGHTTNRHIAFAYPLSWAVTSILFLIYYLRGRWLRRRIGPVPSF